MPIVNAYPQPPSRLFRPTARPVSEIRSSFPGNFSQAGMLDPIGIPHVYLFSSIAVRPSAALTASCHVCKICYNEAVIDGAEAQG